MLKLLDKSIKKSLCFVPKAVHHSLLIDREIGVSVCDKNFCLCDNIIKKIMEDQKINIVNLSMKEKDEKPKFDNIGFKCD